MLKSCASVNQSLNWSGKFTLLISREITALHTVYAFYFHSPGYRDMSAEDFHLFDRSRNSTKFCFNKLSDWLVLPSFDWRFLGDFRSVNASNLFTSISLCLIVPPSAAFRVLIWDSFASWYLPDGRWHNFRGDSFPLWGISSIMLGNLFYKITY